MSRWKPRTAKEAIEDGSIPVPFSGCWLWTGVLNRSGYGQTRPPGTGGNKRVLAHRVSYEAFVGPIPPGLFVCHSCDVRCCVNPDHLFVGVNLDNCRDMASKGRGTSSAQGLPRGVCLDKRMADGSRRFTAQRQVAGRVYCLGSFLTAEDAAAAVALHRVELP